ncbi:hypothetical protein DPMN_065624 [Dreissena polymorpha]|uniref:Uncharacterized protein n=1 Tax=Dreissena polymorpha TaxID=45954 RepID=A0A9D3YUX8_DREPO|nr:hypothetical protein DPMN_065624 [Dreissena polymorpha]
MAPLRNTQESLMSSVKILNTQEIIPAENATLTSSNDVNFSDKFGFILQHANLLKAVVLCVVIVVLMVTTCQFVFKLFSGYVDDDRK